MTIAYTIAILLFGLAFGRTQATPWAAGSPDVSSSTAYQMPCTAKMDTLMAMFNRNDPAYLNWNMLDHGCDAGQIYKAFFHQALGFYFLSTWDESLLYFSLAREIGGPWDEQILFYQFDIYRRQGIIQDQDRLIREVQMHFPGSTFLPGMLDFRKRGTKSGNPWFLNARGGVSGSRGPLDYSRTYWYNGIYLGRESKYGNHRLEHGIGTSITADTERWIFEGWQARAKGVYRYRGFQADLDVGLSYRNSADTLGREGEPWTLGQGRVGLGQAFLLPGKMDARFTLGLSRLRSGWDVFSVGQDVHFFLGKIPLVFSLGVDRHWIGFQEPNPFFRNLVGLYGGSASTTALFFFDKHDLAISAEYRPELEILDKPGDLNLDPDSVPNLKQVLGMILAYTYGFTKNLSISLEMEGGYSLNLPYKSRNDPYLRLGMMFHFSR